jgi:hypothetical protein
MRLDMSRLVSRRRIQRQEAPMTSRLLSARAGIVATLVLLLSLPSSPVEAGRRPTEKWRAMIGSLPPGTPLEVRLHDGTLCVGVLTHVTDEGFTLVGESAFESVTLRYQDPKVVKKVKNWKPGKTLTIVILVSAAAGFTLLAMSKR